VGWFGDAPKLAVAAPPVGGAANEEARRVIADTFGVRRRQVRLVIGAASRTKHFEIDGVDAAAIARRLDEVLPGR
jgi:hypothetical protein